MGQQMVISQSSPLRHKQPQASVELDIASAEQGVLSGKTPSESTSSSSTPNPVPLIQRSQVAAGGLVRMFVPLKLSSSDGRVECLLRKRVKARRLFASCLGIRLQHVPPNVHKRGAAPLSEENHGINDHIIETPLR